MGRRRVTLTLALCCTVALAACTASWQSQFQRGEKLEQQGHPAEALAVYDAWLRVAPATDKQLIAKIQHRRAECLWRLQRPADAFSALQKSVEADPNNRAARLRLAEIYMAGGASNEAIEQATQVLNGDPRNADAFYLMGLIYAGSGRIEQSRDAFAKVLEIDPSRHPGLARTRRSVRRRRPP